jgi:hypothetical protein
LFFGFLGLIGFLVFLLTPGVLNINWKCFCTWMLLWVKRCVWEWGSSCFLLGNTSKQYFYLFF